MTFREYKIRHTKTADGTDIYTILSVYFGFIKFVFKIPELRLSLDDYHKRQIRYNTNLFSSLEDAKESLNYYTKNKYATYRGYILMKCLIFGKVESWVVLSSRSLSTKIWEFEYNMFGTLDECKKLIDEDIEIKQNKKFSEIIDL